MVFLTLKLIAVIGSTLIILISYFIVRNIFNYKIAIISQLFVATNFKLFYLSYSALNEIIPLTLIFASLYFVTKPKFNLYDLIICGLVLGIATSFRYQALVIFIGIIIFLIVRNKQVKYNLRHVFIFFDDFCFSTKSCFST